MLKPEEMCRVSVVGPKSAMRETIDALYGMKVLHIEDFYKEREGVLSERFGLKMGTPLGEAEGAASSLVRLRSLQSHLFQPEEAVHPAAEASQKDIAALERDVLSLSEKLKTIDELRARILASIGELEVFEELPLGLENLSDYKSVSVLAGYLDAKVTKNELIAAIGNISSRSRIFFWQHKKKPVVLVFVESQKKDTVLKLLAEEGFSEINLSGISSLRGSAVDNLHALITKAEQLEKVRAHTKRKLAELSRRWFWALQDKEKEFLSASERAQAPLRFATTASTFIADGWVPCSTYDAMLESLEAATKGKVYVEKYPDSHDAPVKLAHPKPVEPFEFFMNLYSLPRYTEVDPTFFMFLTFPLFFGMMLGDIGYGLLTTALFLFLRRKTTDKSVRALLNVMLFASVASIMFGFVFGEFFGEEAVFGLELPHLISRVHSVNEMLLVTVGIGVVQLNIGLLLGFYNKMKEHGFIHAFLEKGSWFVLEAGVAFIAADYLGYLAASPYIGYGLVSVAVLMLLKAEGIKGVVEIPALLSNTLSYARLMAVGLASVSLALVVNEFAGEFFHMGGIYMLIAVIILVLGHAVNLALGILGPFLHSLRLHYVEFFTKFFEGGGKRYEPFGK